jgi:DNA-binding MurR/RpiR family transcriptional regulator
MRETINSMMRFSGAVTMFGLEQVQNAISAPTDTKAAMNRLRDTLDSMSSSLASKLDDSKKSALDSMSKAQIDMLDRTANAVDNVTMDSAADLLKRTSDTLAGAMRGSAKAAGAA